LRIAHLSDFHVERLTQREEKVLALLDELRPDLIVYTGDMLSYSYMDDPVAQAECRALMSRLRAPLGVFAVPGTPLVDTETALHNVLGDLSNITLLRDCVFLSIKRSSDRFELHDLQSTRPTSILWLTDWPSEITLCCCTTRPI
jgi:predicted MPP superfamily phosphohydrolase